MGVKRNRYFVCGILIKDSLGVSRQILFINWPLLCTNVARSNLPTVQNLEIKLTYQVPAQPVNIMFVVLKYIAKECIHFYSFCSVYGYICAFDLFSDRHRSTCQGSRLLKPRSHNTCCKARPQTLFMARLAWYICTQRARWS